MLVMMSSAREGYTGGQVAAELDCGVELDCVKRCQSSERSSSLLFSHHCILDSLVEIDI